MRHISFNSHRLITANVPYERVVRNSDLDSFATHRRSVGLGSPDLCLFRKTDMAGFHSWNPHCVSPTGPPPPPSTAIVFADIANPLAAAVELWHVLSAVSVLPGHWQTWGRGLSVKADEPYCLNLSLRALGAAHAGPVLQGDSLCSVSW